jgi:choline-sulfatase
MEAGMMDDPLCPYTHYLHDQGRFQGFYQDYQVRRKCGWTAGAAHDSVLSTEHFHDTYIGRTAVSWLENVSGEFPWFYHASFVGPHSPFDPPTEYADRYRDACTPEPIAGSPDRKPRWYRARRREIVPEEIAVTRRQYCGAIELIDDQVGLMLEVLERRNMVESTYIVFTSDHGEMLGDHGLYSKEVPYESSIRIPLVVAGPGIQGNRAANALVELADLNPTVCDWAGLPPQENIDARSLCGVLSGADWQHRDNVVSMIRNWRMIRTERFKLVDNYNELPELYDLQEDPWELNNIAQANPEVVSDMRARLTSRISGCRWLR